MAKTMYKITVHPIDSGWCAVLHKSVEVLGSIEWSEVRNKYVMAPTREGAIKKGEEMMADAVDMDRRREAYWNEMITITQDGTIAASPGAHKAADAIHGEAS